MSAYYKTMANKYKEQRDIAISDLAICEKENRTLYRKLHHREEKTSKLERSEKNLIKQNKKLNNEIRNLKNRIETIESQKVELSKSTHSADYWRRLYIAQLKR